MGSIRVYDAAGALIGELSAQDAATRMNTSVEELEIYLERDGYCLVDDPAVLVALADDQPDVTARAVLDLPLT